MKNASVTIERNPVDYDDETGNRKEKSSPDIVLQDTPCFYAPSRTSRRVYADTLRQSVKLVPTLTLNDPGGLDIRVGDKAFVTWLDVTTEYTIGYALITRGIGFRKWYIELEAIDVPAA